MRVILIWVLALCLNHFTAFGQAHREWVLQDDTLIDQVKKVVSFGPATIESYFKLNGGQRSLDSLGFNWIKKEWTVPGGYISFYADFYYLNDSLKTLILWVHLPDDFSLVEHYYASYSTFLPIDSGDAFYYKYCPQNLFKPLEEYSLVKNHIRPSFEMLKYMSPTSSLFYGYRGGFSGEVLPNRAAFESLKAKLSMDQVFALMYSINPASRLTAIEFFLKNKSRFKSSNEIQSWIRRVYSEKPKIETFNGCLQSEKSSAFLVQMFVKSTSK